MGNNLLTMSRESVNAFCSEVIDSYCVEPIVDSLSSGVIFTDSTGILTYMNRKAETILQVHKNSVIGKRIDMLPLRTPLYKVMSEDCRDFPMEMNIRGRIFEVKSSEVLSEGNKVLGCITELFDVTQERCDKRRREEFVAKMTHDLKTPLMVLQGNMQAIKLGMWGDVPPKLKRTLDDMERSSKNLHSMIEDLLDVYRLEMGLVQIKRKECDVVEFLDACCLDRQSEAEEQGISLSVRFSGAIRPVLIDCKQMARVFANVIGNAIKFTPRNGKVAVKAQMSNGAIHIAVRDNGIGIPQKDLPHVFKKYFRSEQAAGFRGSGLGLALSKEIVEAHGGTINVESREGKGSIFTIILPVSELNP